MKIALVSQEYPPETARGGIGSQTHAKAKGLVALGHEVFVISRSTDLHRSELLEGGVHIIRTVGMEDRLPEMTEPVQWITHSSIVAAEIEALDSKVGLDLIDFPEWGAEGYIYLLNRTPWRKVTTVIQLHGPLVMMAHALGWPDLSSEFYTVGTHMESTSLRLADAVYSSSQCSVGWVREYYDIQKGEIPIIHLGIDIHKFSRKEVQKSERPTILFSGKIVPNKGIFELVECAAALVSSFPQLRLRIIGRGDDIVIQKLMDLAKSLGAPHLLEFAGFISKEDLPTELSKAHIFAAPSHYEGGPGFVYLEAMACGLPVIACSGSGVNEVITDGVTGILVPPRNTTALREALFSLLKDESFAQQLSEKAVEYVQRHASTDICIKKLEALYFSVLENAKVVGSNAFVL